MRPKYSKEQKAEIVEGLLNLRREGKLRGVWYSDGILEVRTLAIGPLEYLPWHTAASMVGYRPAPTDSPFRTVTPKRQHPTLKFKPLLRPMKGVS